MFLITTSRAGVPKQLPFQNTRFMQVANLAVWIGWDGCGFQWSEDQDGWTLTQRLCVNDKMVLDGVRLEMGFCRQKMTMTARISSVAGVPAYYYIAPSGDFFLSSRVHTLREAGVPITENVKALPEFLAYRCLMGPDTLFLGIKRVTQGGVLTCSFSAEQPDVRQAALADRLHAKSLISGTLNDHVSVLIERLARTLQPLAPITDHVAMILSGGIDSSILCRLAERDLGLRNTISTGYPFEDAEKDVERHYALTAARAMGFSHNCFESTPERYLVGLVESVGHAEAPVHHLQSACMHLLAKDGVDASHNVIVQGLGAGGCLGNFRNYLFLRDKCWPKLLASEPIYSLINLIPSMTGRGRTYLGKLRDIRNRLPLNNPGNPIWKWHQYGDTSWICGFCGVTPYDIVERHMERVRGLGTESLYDVWALYSLLGDEEATLALWSAIAAGSGKTFYSPFYDEGFLQYVQTIPWSIKLGGPENILRKSIASRLGVPDFILNRRKTGFGVKRDDWALEGGVFDPLAKLASDVVGKKEISGLRSRDPKKAMLFWNLVNYALWKRICVDGESPQDIISGLII
jgi:asparagine synthetase B (glutamine-hydrolysing)